MITDLNRQRLLRQLQKASDPTLNKNIRKIHTKYNQSNYPNTTEPAKGYNTSKVAKHGIGGKAFT